MKLTFSNGKDKQKDINIKGKCTITDYDPRKSTPLKDNLTIKVDDENTSIMNGTELQQEQQTVTMNAQKYSIFTAIAGMDGDENDLTQKDIAKAKELFKNYNDLLANGNDESKMTAKEKEKANEIREKWENLLNIGVTSIKYDSHAGVATIVIGDNKFLRIDFQTWRERIGLCEDSSAKTTTETAVEYKSYDSFFSEFGKRESSGDPTNMSVSKEDKLGYAGLYQIGEQALADLGIYYKSGEYNNDWKGTFKENKYGITSLSDFLNSTDKQHAVFIDILKKNWEHIENYELDEYVGKIINGQEITVSGMLAGAHLVGSDDLKAYLRADGIIDPEPADDNGTKISEYIKKFSNYDMESITDIPPGAKVVYENCEYTVRKGDNLTKIAKQFHTTVHRITKASNIKKDEFIHAGEVLTVPARKIIN